MEIVEIAGKCGIWLFHRDTPEGINTKMIIPKGAPVSRIKWTAVKFRNFSYAATLY